MGIISTGCAQCRKRRIKCDEAKPGCNRCFKIGKPCPGYDRALKVVLYTEHGESRKKVTRDSNPKKSSTSPAASNPTCSNDRRPGLIWPDASFLRSTPARSDTTSGDSSAAVALVRHPTSSFTTDLQPGLTSDIEIRSVCLFVTSFVQNPQSQGKSPALLDFLPALYASSPPSSCLHQTLVAVAQLNFLNRYKASDALSESAKYSYGRALRSINTALMDRSLATTDGTLTAVWLLSLYELLVPGNLAIGQRTPWVNHVMGTMHLLRMRGNTQMATRTGRLLFGLSHLPIIIMTMMTGGNPSQEIAKLNEAVLLHDPEESKGPVLVSRYIQRVATTRSKLKDWIEKHVSVMPQAEDMVDLQAIIQLSMQIEKDGEFKQWVCETPEWQPNPVSKGTSIQLEHPSFAKHYFSSTYIMWYYATVWTAKLLHLQSILKGLILLKPQTRELKHSSEENEPATDIDSATLGADVSALKSDLIDAADHILGTAAFAFGEINNMGTLASSPTGYSSVHNSSAVGALNMFWPVGAIMACPFASLEQKNLARTALRNIGERFCIMQALEYTAF